jgi:methylenetetrahydrofolate reductase (NADPH)
MPRIAVEIVVRQEQEFVQELKRIKNKFGHAVQAINIPDIGKFPFDSWQGCELVKPYFSDIIPHFRAKYIDKDKPLSFKNVLLENGVKEVLIIAGDPPEDPNHPGYYNNSTLDIIKKFRDELPDIKVYAGIDQYRGDLKSELNYAEQKLKAGAEGFFTNPFFDMDFMRLYHKYLLETEVFWGVCPVNTKSSQRYWEKTNNVIFPPDFIPSNQWSRSFARESLDFAKLNKKASLYFMPIVVDVEEYLNGIL